MSPGELVVFDLKTGLPVLYEAGRIDGQVGQDDVPGRDRRQLKTGCGNYAASEMTQGPRTSTSAPTNEISAGSRAP